MATSPEGKRKRDDSDPEDTTEVKKPRITNEADDIVTNHVEANESKDFNQRTPSAHVVMTAAEVSSIEEPKHVLEPLRRIEAKNPETTNGVNVGISGDVEKDNDMTPKQAVAGSTEKTIYEEVHSNGKRKHDYEPDDAIELKKPSSPNDADEVVSDHHGKSNDEISGEVSSSSDVTTIITEAPSNGKRKREPEPDDARNAKKSRPTNGADDASLEHDEEDDENDGSDDENDNEKDGEMSDETAPILDESILTEVPAVRKQSKVVSEFNRWLTAKRAKLGTTNDEDILRIPAEPDEDTTEDTKKTSPISKNKLKKGLKTLWRQETRGEFKRQKKEKLKAAKVRKRAVRDKAAIQAAADATTSTTDGDGVAAGGSARRHGPIKVPITFIFDCQFDGLMTENEMISLASQLTRCYSDNRKAPFKAQLAVSSFGGKLKKRFDTVLVGSHENWHDIEFSEKDFAEVAQLAKQSMGSPKGGAIAGALARPESSEGEDAQIEDSDSPVEEIVYLTSDSPNTLHKLKPFSTYIIGGLVDKNRHKGICYQRAMDRNISTAKLPIGEFLQMQSRQVLTTNHVNEIMLKWLQLGDWGEAMMQVMPKRKGAVSRTETEEAKKEASSGFKEAADPSDTRTADKRDTDQTVSGQTPGHEESGPNAVASTN